MRRFNPARAGRWSVPLLGTATALLIAVAACTPPSGQSVTAPSSSSLPARTTAPPAGLKQVHDPGMVTGTIAGPCRARGQLPDPRCTPGAYDPAVTAAVLCAHGYSTAAYRPPASDTTRFKYGQAYPAYGLPASERTELDHLVSLELGGANDAANLWPEPPPSPNPKDETEGDLRAWVCAAKGATAQDRLTRAQIAIAADWTAALADLGIPA